METRNIKIRSLMNTNLEFVDRSHSKFSQSFVDFLVDTDEKFREKLIVSINDQIGLFNWAIDFIENPSEGFLVDIYCDSPVDFQKIYGMIIERFPDIEFRFYNKGPINTHVPSQ